METLKFTLQIDMFRTNTDEWESQDSFWCAFNEGAFREDSSGNCKTWEDTWWHIGKVEKNRYNSYDLVQGTGKIYKTEEEALEALPE